MKTFRVVVFLSLVSLGGAFSPLNGRGPAQSTPVSVASLAKGRARQTPSDVATDNESSSSFLPFPSAQWSALSMSSTPQGLEVEEDSSPTWRFDPFFAALPAIFLAYAFFVAPGEFGSAKDQALFENFIANPIKPEGFEPLFFAIFNLLGFIPLIAASVALPQGSPKGLPAGPFLAASAMLGFPAASPYFIFRAPTCESTAEASTNMSWFTKNVIENKIFNWALVGFVVYTLQSAGVFTAVEQDGLGEVWHNFLEFAADSKFVSASSADALVYSVAVSALIAKDAKLRYPKMDTATSYLVGAKALLLPFVGPALYCAIRPKLPTSPSSDQ